MRGVLFKWVGRTTKTNGYWSHETIKVATILRGSQMLRILQADNIHIATYSRFCGSEELEDRAGRCVIKNIIQ